MADEPNQFPRRSTRAQKPDTSDESQMGSGTKANQPKRPDPSTPATVNGEAASKPGKREPLNARNDRPGKSNPSGPQDVSQGKRPTGGSKTPQAPAPNASVGVPSGTSKSARNQQPQKKSQNPLDMGAADTPKPKKSDERQPKSGAADKAESSKPAGTQSKANDAADTAKSGAKNKAKSELKGSNATGVDYSDKKLKDQLEHQAADLAMDATPGLGQVNSARKALKSVNKQKREASGNPDSDDLLDKTEKVVDKGVDGGIKGVKLLLGSAVASNAGFGAAMMLMVMKTIMFLKGMVLGIAGKIAGFFAGAFQAISSFVSGVLGVSATIGNMVASGAMAFALTVTSVVGFITVDMVTLKDPGVGACLPTQEAVDTVSQDYVEAGGEAALLQEENAGKLWSVYSAMGGSKEQTAAVLGNLHYESGGLDPTATETISSEPFVMGPLKLDALAKDYNVNAIAPDYAARFPAIQRIGIGLAQWTNGRNSLLINYAKDKGSNWYEFDTQIGFMLAGDEPYRQEQLKDFLAATPGTIDAETERFMNSWIGLSSPNASSGARQEHAVSYLFTLERATADTAYAEGILSGLNVNRGEGNAAAGAFHHDDGCGDAIATHYAGDKAEDGTGEVPSGLALVPWTRETLPESLKTYAVSPELAGLAWGNGAGWTTGIYPGQCVGFATSYFMQLYPEWDKDGRPGTRPFGNGKDTAPGWASHYGASTTTAPSTGSVFSNKTSSVYGHTGIVQHVFANGDILVVEQNIRGASGDANGQQHSWSWRVIKTDRYQQDNWVFFKPNGAEPLWDKPSA